MAAVQAPAAVLPVCEGEASRVRIMITPRPGAPPEHVALPAPPSFSFKYMQQAVGYNILFCGSTVTAEASKWLEGGKRRREDAEAAMRLDVDGSRKCALPPGYANETTNNLRNRQASRG